MKGTINRFLYNQKAAPYVMISPFLIMFSVFYLYSVIFSFVKSFFRIKPGVENFIGLGNYTRLWSDSHFATAIGNNTWYVFWAIVILVPLSLLIAMMLNAKWLPFKSFFRACVFIPSLTSVIVAGVVFRLIFGEFDSSLLNQVVIALGGQPHIWLRESAQTAMLVMITLTVWRWIGPTMLYFLAALQSVSLDTLEAADIDGASAVKKFFYIILPHLKPITIYVVTIQIYGGFSMFTESFVYWKDRSPRDIGQTMVTYLYQKGFAQADMGYAYAIGMILLVIIFAVSMVQLNAFGMFKKEDGNG